MISLGDKQALKSRVQFLLPSFRSVRQAHYGAPQATTPNRFVCIARCKKALSTTAQTKTVSRKWDIVVMTCVSICFFILRFIFCLVCFL